MHDSMMEEKRGFLSNTALHTLAMLLMLGDHLWATYLMGCDALMWAGRLAFPIFAFLAAEGASRTGDRKKYMLRLLFAALISEIPFNLLYSGSVIYPVHQNVIWTLLLSVAAIHMMEKTGKGRGILPRVLLSAAFSFVAVILGYLSFSDYYGAGVLTVLLFYFTRGRGWWRRALEAVGMWWINTVLLGGMSYPVTLFSFSFDIPLQGAAIVSLLFIWLYNGEKGRGGKSFRYFSYLFYPLHMLLLGLASFVF